MDAINLARLPVVYTIRRHPFRLSHRCLERIFLYRGAGHVLLCNRSLGASTKILEKASGTIKRHGMAWTRSVNMWYSDYALYHPYPGLDDAMQATIREDNILSERDMVPLNLYVIFISCYT